MNRLHRWYCRSGHWGRTVRERLLPWVLDSVSLGADVLEIGPGPGLTTDALQERVPRLTCVEIDPRLAESLARRKRGTHVEVLEADATALPFAAGRFSAAVSCTMLHHVPSPEQQDRLLAEVARVLAPGGWFVGSDSLTSPLFRLVHWGDTLVPVDPESLPRRLGRAGFERIDVRRAGGTFRFRAVRAAR
ncbi:MAG: class I SAM-dependent methyltransferase [Proteobacteria bacterium]|nr:class I SAM-dependent methyltransferase [Pseudomonadota bacterium]